jgi:fumarylpyruvate hydrolase
VSAEGALDLVYGYAVGIDLTRRDLQAEAKKLGRPWDMGKGFDHSAPLGPITRGHPPASGSICLYINDHIKQSGDLTQMIWGVADIIAILSGFVLLGAGDLIFTGTPSGVGPIQRGDRLRGEVAGCDPIEVSFT